MKAVVFRTPGLIDIRSFTMFGVNSKPNSDNPIGFFGTGLKYAIAVLVRMGIPVTIYIGTKKYTFYKKQEKFREKGFEFVRMKRNDWSLFQWGKAKYEDLPFTTELGKTWALWMVFRELYTNTIDENGITSIWDGARYDGIEAWEAEIPARSNETLIIVEGDLFVQEFLDKEKNFLPDGMRERQGTERMQVFDRQSRHVYYRGMRVLDLDKPSEFTYNLLCDIKLTEDRTAAEPFAIEREVSQYLLEQKDKDRLRQVLHTPERYESSLNVHYAYRAPSPEFREVAQEKATVNPHARAYGRLYEPVAKVENPLSGNPRPWAATGLPGRIELVDANGIYVGTLLTELSSEATAYMVELLQQDLEDAALTRWVNAYQKSQLKPEPEPVQVVSDTLQYESEDDDVPF